MSLELPSDLTALAPDDVNPYESAGVYVLELSKPATVVDEWDNTYDHRPPWFEDFTNAERILYVGGSKNVLSRLEDHRDGEVRQTVLTRVCSVESLEEVWFYEDADESFLRESQHAIELDNETPNSVFVRSA